MRNPPRNTILEGDAKRRLSELPRHCVDCVITSPPYFLLRDYGVSGQLGLEASVGEWVDDLRAVCRELFRVLKPTGSLWLNLGDSFSRHARYGAPAKGLLLAPERLALALAQDGWLIRNKVVWAKPNPTPTSVRDRLGLTYEIVYFLTRQPHYFFDLDAIREPHHSTSARRARPRIVRESWRGPLAGTRDGLRRARTDGTPGHPLGKNPGDVWTIPTHGFRGAHFATFPPALVRRPLLATCPEVVCTRCGDPWKRRRTARQAPAVLASQPSPKAQEIGSLESCGCGAPTVPGLVLDPFFGTGTTGIVAREHGRDWLGVELNPEYVQLAATRLGVVETAA